MRPSVRVAVAAVVIGLALAVTWLLRPMPQPEPTMTPPVAATEEASTEFVSLDGAALRGSRKAPLAVIVYSDFQCPFCGHFADTAFRELDTDYIAEGKVVFAFRHFPLSDHNQAFAAASAAACAGRQGKFWEMHDQLFANAKTLATAPWRTFAADLGLNRAQFDSCLDKEGPEIVRRDLALAEPLEISGTPSFLIGRVGPDGRVRVLDRVAGAVPFISFKKIIDPLLANPPAS
jgi:protein-disulfide isomerase